MKTLCVASGSCTLSAVYGIINETRKGLEIPAPRRARNPQPPAREERAGTGAAGGTAATTGERGAAKPRATRGSAPRTRRSGGGGGDRARRASAPRAERTTNGRERQRGERERGETARRAGGAAKPTSHAERSQGAEGGEPARSGASQPGATGATREHTANVPERMSAQGQPRDGRRQRPRTEGGKLSLDKQCPLMVW